MKTKKKLILLLFILFYNVYSNNELYNSKLFANNIFYNHIDLLNEKSTTEVLSLFRNKEKYGLLTDNVYLAEISILYNEKKYKELIDYTTKIKTKINNKYVLDLCYFFEGLTHFQLKNFTRSLDSFSKINHYEHLKKGYTTIIYFYLDSVNNFNFYKEEFFLLLENPKYYHLYALISLLDIRTAYNNERHLVKSKYNKYRKYLTYDNEILIDGFRYFFDALLEAGQFNQIYNELQKLEQLNNNIISYYKGYYYLKNLDFKNSKSTFYSIIENIKETDIKTEIELLNYVYLRLGQLYLLKNKYNKTVNYLSKIDSCDIEEQMNIEKSIILGYAYHFLNDDEKALHYFTNIDKDNYEYFNTYFNEIIITAFNNNDYQVILNIFNLISDEKKTDEFIANYYKYYLWALYNNENFDDIIKIYQELKNNNLLVYTNELTIIIGQTYEKLKNNNKAIEYLKKSAETTKNSTQLDLIYNKIGNLYFNDENTISALHYYEKVNNLNLVGMKIMSLYYETQQFTLLRNLINKLENKVENDELVSVQLFKYKYYLSQGKTKSATKVLEHIDKDYFDFNIFYNFILVYYNNNDIKEFNYTFNQNIDLFSDEDEFIDVLNLYIDINFKNSNYENVLKGIEKIIVSYEEVHPTIYFKKSDTLRNQKKFNASNEILYNIIKKNIDKETTEKAYYRIALNYYHDDNLVESLNALLKVETVFQEYVRYLYANIYFILEDYNNALSNYKYIIENYYDFYKIDEVLYKYSFLLIRNNEYKFAEKFLLKIIDNFKNSIYYNNAIFILANNTYNQNDYDETIKLLKNIVNIEDTLFEIDYYKLLGKSYKKTGNYKESININNILLDKVASFYKTGLLFDNAYYYYLLKKQDKSNEILGYLISSTFFDADRYLYLSASNYIISGDYESSYKTLKKVKNKNSDEYKLLSYTLDILSEEDKNYYLLDEINVNELQNKYQLNYIYVLISNKLYLNETIKANDLIQRLISEDKTKLFVNKIETLKSKYEK